MDMSDVGKTDEPNEFTEAWQTALVEAYMTGYKASHAACLQLITAYRDERECMLIDADKFIKEKMSKTRLEHNRVMDDWSRHADCVNAMNFIMLSMQAHGKKMGVVK